MKQIALLLLAVSLASAQVQDFSACINQVTCVPASLTVGTPSYVNWAFSYFSTPVTVTMYAGTASSTAQGNCKSISNAVLQEWTIVNPTLDTATALGYYSMTIAPNSVASASQSVFFRFYSAPNGNCVVNMAPVTVLQSSLVASTSSIVQAISSTLPSKNGATNTPNSTDSPQSTTNITTIIIAASAIAGVVLLLFIILLIVFIRRRKTSKSDLLNESLMRKEMGTLTPHHRQSMSSSDPEASLFAQHTLTDDRTNEANPFSDVHKLGTVDAQLIAATFRKELADPLMSSSAWDGNSTFGSVVREDSKKSHASSNISPFSNLGLERIV